MVPDEVDELSLSASASLQAVPSPCIQADEISAPPGPSPLLPLSPALPALVALPLHAAPFSNSLITLVKVLMPLEHVICEICLNVKAGTILLNAGCFLFLFILKTDLLKESLRLTGDSNSQARD